MVILSCIYNLFIGPLELFFEVVYAIALRVIDNPGLAIIILSLAMNVLVLPLYRRADAVQEAERDRAAAMKPWVDHIKKTFKGDEQFMMLQTYYRQMGYKQTDQLRGSISLLLEIPFFIAAYHFLSNLELLRGVPFGPITDLGAPDGLLQIGDITLNVLPILMTVINVISAAIYLKGFPVSSKVQMYGIAAIFLVLLYNSPAGLVFYWTLNNIFNLVKNIFYKLKHPREVLAVLLAIIGVGLLVFIIGIHPLQSKMRQLFAVCLAVVLMLPLLKFLIDRRSGKREKSKRFKALFPEDPKVDNRAFLYAGIFLAVLTGFLIPTSVIAASPAEFVDLTTLQSPLLYVLQSFCLAVGTFVIWFGVFYRLATPRGKALFGFAMWALVGIAIVDYLFFGTGYGTLSPLLRFDTAPEVFYRDIFINLVVIIVVAAALYVVWRFKRPIAKVACLCLCIAAVAMSAMNAYTITQGTASIMAQGLAGDLENRPHFTLSKTGKNVVVIMMDRAVSYYVPFILNERPDIAKKLEGFTFYSNSASYGHGTQVGSTPLYGGYDYIPENQNKRSDVALVDKQNEALKVMPVLFDQEGYDVTVFDPTYANYEWVSDLSIYNDYPDIKTYHTMDGSFKYSNPEIESESGTGKDSRERNFFCYSLFKIAPVALHRTLYSEGTYNSTSSAQQASEQIQYTNSSAVGVREGFLNSYGVLDSLPDISVITDDNVNTFLMMSNDTAHEPMLLKEPDFTPAWKVDNTAYDQEHVIRVSIDGAETTLEEEEVGAANNKMMHYHVNAAALDKLGDWCNYLRENGLYDNTRIIVVSDHGKDISPEGADDLHIDMVNSEGEPGKTDLRVFTSLLMVKDFDSDTFVIDDTLMTNADTPALAMQGLIDNPRNPFTGNPIDMSGKETYPVRVYYLVKWWLSLYDNGIYSYDPGYWFEVHDNVNDVSNWEFLGYY